MYVTPVRTIKKVPLNISMVSITFYPACLPWWHAISDMIRCKNIRNVYYNICIYSLALICIILTIWLSYPYRRRVSWSLVNRSDDTQLWYAVSICHSDDDIRYNPIHLELIFVQSSKEILIRHGASVAYLPFA